MSARYSSGWWATRPGDLTIRAIGTASLGLCWLAISSLANLVRSGAGQGMSALGLAALGFASGCAGAAALVLGRGLFDRIEISARWRAQDNQGRVG
jgi:hypothetical protein